MGSKPMENRSKNTLHKCIEPVIYAEVDIKGNTHKLTPLTFEEWNRYTCKRHERETMKNILIDHAIPSIDKLGSFLDDNGIDAEELVNIIFTISKFDDRDMVSGVNRWKEWSLRTMEGVYDLLILRYTNMDYDLLYKCWQYPDIYERVVATIELTTGISVVERRKIAIDNNEPIDLRLQAEIDAEGGRRRPQQRQYVPQTPAESELLNAIMRDKENPKDNFDFNKDLEEEQKIQLQLERELWTQSKD